MTSPGQQDGQQIGQQGVQQEVQQDGAVEERRMVTTTADPRLEAEARATVQRHTDEARERGREIAPEVAEAMVRAELYRLANRTQRDPSRPRLTAEEARVPALRPLGGLLGPPRSYHGRPLRPGEYEAAQQAVPEPPPVRCERCHDAGEVLVPFGHARDSQRPGRSRAGTVREVDGAYYEPVCCPACPAEEQRRRNLRGTLTLHDLEEARFTLFTPETPSQVNALAVVQRWALAWRGEEGDREERPFLIMRGPKGAGKSMLAKAALLYRSEHGERCVWNTTGGILRAIKATFDRQAEEALLAGREPSTRFAYEQWVAAPVLAMDDLGREHASGWGAGELSSMLMDRYEARRPTVITTNMSLDAIGAKFDDQYDRLMDRLGDRRFTIYLEVEGPSRVERSTRDEE